MVFDKLMLFYLLFINLMVLFLFSSIVLNIDGAIIDDNGLIFYIINCKITNECYFFLYFIMISLISLLIITISTIITNINGTILCGTELNIYYSMENA